MTPTRPPGVGRAFRLPWSKRRAERELDDEVRFHLEMRVTDLVARGVAPDDARAEALRRFGDTAELHDYCQSVEVPHMRRVHAREWLDSWLQDLRFALRQFRRSPGFVAATVVTLALGIGATTAIFSVVNGVLLRALPYPAPQRIIQLWEVSPKGNELQVSDANFADLRTRTRSFDAMAEFNDASPVSISGAVAPMRASMAWVTRDFFGVLGTQPVVGRTFTSDEASEHGAKAVIVSYGFWQSALGASRDVLGKSILVGQDPFTIVGVMPPSMDLPAGTQLWGAREQFGTLPSRTAHNNKVIARLRAGTTLDAARRDASRVAIDLLAQLGSRTDMADVAIVPLQEQLVGGTRSTLLVLLAASAVLLLIACANVVNLLVARIVVRQGELALRVALGAARGRIVQQCLAESSVLAVAGGALGVAIAAVGTRALLALDPAKLPRSGEVRLDGAVLAFAIGLAAVTAVALGLLTAWRATRGNLREALSASQRSMSGAASAAGTRRTLVVAQVAMTLVLLVAAGLLGRSFVRLLSVDPGFRTERSLVLDLSVDAGDSVAMAQRAQLYGDVIARLATIPGVTAVGGINAIPLDAGGGADGTFIEMTGPDEKIDFTNFETLMHDPSRAGHAEFRVASGGYFGAMHIPLIEGRTFDDRDGATSTHVAVVSQSLARARWPGQSPIGKWIQFGNMDGDLHPFMVVGVVGDVRDASLAAEPRPTFYADFAQRRRTIEQFNVVIAGPASPESVVPAARDVVRRLRPELPPRFRTIESIVATSVSDRRFVLLLIAVFAGAALLLAALGVYSVISYLVAQRTRELSIRVALGARSNDIVRMVLGQGFSLALVGIVVGAIGAALASRLLAGMLYGVSATDPVAFAGVIGVVAIVAVVACWVPARRASRVEAMDVLRGG